MKRSKHRGRLRGNPGGVPNSKTPRSFGIGQRTLSPAQDRFVDLMQEIGFGRIEGVTVRNGQPVFDPPPRVVREIKFGRKNNPGCKQRGGEFALKTQVQQLFAHFASLGDGTVERIVIQHGLPFRMDVVERFRA